MTVAQVMDIIARLSGCAGQATDRVSAYTQVKMDDTSTLFKHSKARKSRDLDTLAKNNGLHHGAKQKT